MKIPRKRLFWSVALGHAINDVFMSMGPVILAFLSGTSMGISNAQIGLAQGLRQLNGAVSQPVFGLRADRDGGRWLGALGVTWTVGMTGLSLLLVALTQNFWLFFIPYVISAFGSGAFHPVGAMHAAESDPERPATNVSWFFMMGQTGLALGPLIAGRLLTASAGETVDLFSAIHNPTALFLATLATPADVAIMLLVVPAVIPIGYLMSITIPTINAFRATHPLTQTLDGGFMGIVSAIPRRAGLLLLLLVTLRSLATPGSVTFIPVLFEQKGWSPAEYGMITSSFWIASGFAGVYFGGLADRFDRRWVLAGSMMACAPAFFLLPVVDGLPAFALAMTAGGFSGGAHSLIVVLAQELMPRGKGFATGAILGTIFGMGALGSLLIGVMSDSIGLELAFQIVAVAVTLAGLTGLLLPDKSDRGTIVVSATTGD